MIDDTFPPIHDADLHAWVDDRLSEAARAQVAAHLDTHPAARARVAAWQAEREQLRAALAPIASEPLPDQLNPQRLLALARHGGRVWPGWAGSRHGSWQTRAAAALLLCLGGLIGGLGGWTLHTAWRNGGAEVASPADAADSADSADLIALARDAAASYRVYAPDRIRPVELRAADRALLTAWAQARTGHAIAIPELADAGYRFMGGRVLATAHGAAVLFMYDDDRGDQASRLVLFARPMPGLVQNATDSTMTPLAINDAGLGYSLVGATAAETLHPLAIEARRQIRLGG